MADIDLGFPEERESDWLTNRYFPSKVGGLPAWLELDALPTKEQLQCDQCKNPKSFLCQIYAPFDDDHNFHRSIFIFVCRTETCQQPNKANNLTVLRSQLGRKNDFYSVQPPMEDGDALPEIPSKKKLCLACGCLGPLSCSRCKEANYCSAQHQRAHWPHHKKKCSTNVAGNVNQQTTSEMVTLPEVCFPEWEIVMEPNDEVASASTSETKTYEDEDDDDDDDDEVSEKKRLSEFAKLASQGKTGELNEVPDSELEKYAQCAEVVDDKHFRCFKKEVKHDPEQILRYKRNGQPLWIADVQKTIADQLKIPQCELCSSERQFEFQIMPQMLLLLKDERIDWGVLAVYTCAASCQPPQSVGYLKEYIVKQDIISDEK